jgi:hypothetical protein
MRRQADNWQFTDAVSFSIIVLERKVLEYRASGLQMLILAVIIHFHSDVPSPVCHALRLGRLSLELPTGHGRHICVTSDLSC